MNKTAMNILEFPEIVRQLSEHALSESGRARCLAITPETDPDIIALRLRETEEARAVSGKGGVPLSSLGGMEKVMEKLGKTVNLTPDELSTIRNMNRNVARMMRFMRDRESIAPTISTYAASMDPLEPLSGEIDRCILDNRVDDRASADLARLRKRIAIATDRIRQKLDVLLNAPGTRALLQDSVVGMRGNHYVIPVKREHRQRLDGQVLDVSSSGATVFIEPAAIRTLKNELDLLRLEEEQEVYRVLATLTQQAETHARALRVNLETMAEYDYLFARAKLANGMRAINPALHRKGHSVIVNGRHPLLPGDAVPLNFHIGDGYRALIITGPNTGGKTVVLKTVGLFHLMAQSGLHVPAAEGTTLAVYDDILADIGDGQSITQSLSTFSSHIRNIIAILACAGPRTLAIVDELGTGTDPGEGMGLAVAVMEKLYEKGATLLATTHYSEIKAFASTRPGFKNGCMGFDVETLMPRYTLSIGIPGEQRVSHLAAAGDGSRAGGTRAPHHLSGNQIVPGKPAHGVRPHRKCRRGMGSDPTSGADRLRGQTPPPRHRSRQRSWRAMRMAGNAGRPATRPHELAQEKRRMASPYKLGDCVFVTTMNRTGIVCETENPRGEIGVMIMKNRFMIPHQRIRPFLEGKDLYPEDYDLSTVLDSVQTRKARHKMGKRHVAGLQIVTPGEDNS
jgi:dsDNA-specific endonuclease/ATPase MutS2